MLTDSYNIWQTVYRVNLRVAT